MSRLKYCIPGRRGLSIVRKGGPVCACMRDATNVFALAKSPVYFHRF